MRYKKPILLLALSLSLSACAGGENNTKTQTNDSEVSTQESTELPILYTSFYPVYNLTKQIAGDKFEVRSFTNLKTESHGWEPSAKDIADLSNSKLMFANGAGMEEWEESLENSSDINIINTSEDLDLIEGSHDHEHDHEEADDDNQNHEEDGDDNQSHEEDDHNHGQYDPHTWLSPINGKYQAKRIAENLSDIDPANEDYYMDNYKKIEEELDQIIDEYTEKFYKVDNKNFLVSHQAFGYLARDFMLNQIALTSLMSTEEPDAKTLKEAVDEAKKLGISTVFYEYGGSDKSAKTIANELGADVESLNTLEFATDEELDNEITYQELIRENLEKLYKSMNK